MSGVTSFEEAQEARDLVERVQRFAAFRERVGCYDDWSRVDDLYLLDELADGFYEGTHLLAHMGVRMAREVMSQPSDAHPTAVLDALFWLSDMLVNLYHEELSEQDREIAEAIHGLMLPRWRASRR